MTALAIEAPTSFYQVRTRISSHAPFTYNGEKTISDILRRRGFEHTYESHWYPLLYQLPDGSWCYGGFCPDFRLTATPWRPAILVEVTFADHHHANSSKANIANNLRRLAVKRTKISLTRKHYGIETILITYRTYLRIKRDESYLDRLIQRAARRHHRHQRHQ